MVVNQCFSSQAIEVSKLGEVVAKYEKISAAA